VRELAVALPVSSNHLHRISGFINTVYCRLLIIKDLEMMMQKVGVNGGGVLYGVAHGIYAR